MLKHFLVIATLVLISSGCASASASPERTQLQIREFQTRTYETNDTKMVMKALLNVLQDDGFITKTATLELGLLTAAKEADVSSTGEAFWATFWMGSNAIYKKNSVIECTVNASEFGKQTKVRVVFQMKVLDNRGNVMKVQQVEDEKYYQEFFSKVDKGIFIQKEGL